ncbi:MAG: hypothetical protein QCI38_02200 [Candidatus Thermoplasmatota archaeon]|nr:hypothetical protein [Candidatus Thermoplasmatota archaeon]
MSDLRIRGSVIVGYMQFVKKTWGKAGLEELEKDTNLSIDYFKEGLWYDAEFSNSILAWVRKRGGEEYLKKAGNYLMKNLGFLAYVVRFMNIKTILARAPASYGDAFKYGSVNIDIGDNRAVVTMHDTAVDEHACPAWVGALEGMLELTRTKGTVKETKCQRKGAPNCEFIIEWE